MTLNIPQLQQLKAQVEQELNFYQEAIISLKEVQIKMQESGHCVKSLTTNNSEMLVPVTESMFVHGEVEDTENVLIDIGTGYYIEKTIEEAVDYFKRKVEFLGTQIEKVQLVGREKSGIRGAIMDVLEGKMQSHMAAKQQQLKAPATAQS
jgi:prefoldin alpha subunit